MIARFDGYPNMHLEDVPTRLAGLVALWRMEYGPGKCAPDPVLLGSPRDLAAYADADARLLLAGRGTDRELGFALMSEGLTAAELPRHLRVTSGDEP